MSPKVSILIPVYNVSNYIERCARSLFEQSFQDIEYIFVDDDSPDNSIEILKNVLEEYPVRKTQVKILRHPKNKGLASTRNTAINASTGEYISVVDSDDYVETNMIEELYNFAMDEDADIVVFDMEIKYLDRIEIVSDNISNDKYTNYLNLLTDKNSHNLWNKLIKSTLYKMDECRVPNGLNYNEDFHVYTRVLYFANRVVKINKVYYHYNYMNYQSITKKVSEMHFENSFRFWSLLDEFLKKHNEFERFKLVLDYPKIYRKLRLIIDTNDFKLRKKYANIFLEEEKRCSYMFNNSEKFILWLLRNKLFIILELYRRTIIIKNKIKVLF